MDTSTLPAPTYKTNRGGEVTFHGHGQWVGYPIFDLEQHGIGLKHHIERLEDAVIFTLSQYGLDSHRSDKGAGIWIGNAKICAIGVRASRFVTMWFALNKYGSIFLRCNCPMWNSQCLSYLHASSVRTRSRHAWVSQWLIHALDKYYP